MGILKGIVEFAAQDALIAATDVAIKGLDKMSEAVEKKSDKKLQKFIEANPDHCHLFVSQIRYRFKETYYIYDEQKNVRYIVKGKLFSKKHHLLIFDSTGRTELATVKEKLWAMRSPLSMETNPKDFVIEVHGEKIGKVKTKAAVAKKKFEVTFKDWTVEGDVFGKNYKVLDGDGNLVMVASQKLSYTNDMYFVDITNPEDELYGVLIVLALDSASLSKKDEMKRTIKKRSVL